LHGAILWVMALLTVSVTSMRMRKRLA
jgi:hypothetical protein